MPLLTKTAIIRSFDVEDETRTWVNVAYPDMGVDMGFDGEWLRQGAHGFYMSALQDYHPGLKPEEYTNFWPGGLSVGVKVFCTVDTSVPAGRVTLVRPFPAPFLPGKK